MIKDITIGQYFPGNSPIHKLDARAKIVLIFAFLILIFVCKNFVSIGLAALFVVGVIAISKISFKTILKSIKPILFILLFTFIINLLYGQGEPLVEFWIFKITKSGIYSAFFTSFRIVLLVVSGSLLTYTTSPTSITDAMESLLKPLKLIKVDVHSLAMIMTIALRFIPTLIDEVDKITSAQKSRGANLDSGGIVEKTKALVPIIIPLFVSSFKRAEELAYAMQARCYKGGEGRTKMKKMHFSTRDFVAFAIVVLLYALIIFTNICVGTVI